ncbi:methyltransferase domain-domain-containing protein [Coniella lustricola]|uniref:Methyltransferase domain-domain-containing protein n=1 Tax=Coniella lustricola TaxID=2025994 RepID=A0A2T3AAU1_9PEZI|nr:methyltransferase domain-domain-containing protein [Coniella lustricola]
MLPTPDTSHVPYSRVYEPAEDSFLFLDTISSPSETAFLHQQFSAAGNSTAPLVVEVGPGSGVVIGFVNANAKAIFGTGALTAGIDVNGFACNATATTAKKAADENPDTCGHFLGALKGDLVSPLRDGQVDVLIFNPPYVPTADLPVQDSRLTMEEGQVLTSSARFDRDSYLLSLSYAGGKNGMEITDRLIAALPNALSARGCAYILLCAGNKPEEVKARIENFGPEWRVLTVGDSGKQAGWEKLQIIRIWRETP